MLRDAVAQQEWIQRLEDIVSTHPGANRHSQSLAGVLVQDGQHLVAPTTAELVVHEVDAPIFHGCDCRPKGIKGDLTHRFILVFCGVTNK